MSFWSVSLLPCSSLTWKTANFHRFWLSRSLNLSIKIQRMRWEAHHKINSGIRTYTRTIHEPPSVGWNIALWDRKVEVCQHLHYFQEKPLLVHAINLHPHPSKYIYITQIKAIFLFSFFFESSHVRTFTTVQSSMLSLSMQTLQLH